MDGGNTYFKDNVYRGREQATEYIVCMAAAASVLAHGFRSAVSMACGRRIEQLHLESSLKYLVQQLKRSFTHDPRRFLFQL